MMFALKTLAISVVSISFAVFIALFGRLPVFRKTPIGFLHRLIWIHIPRALSALDSRLTGGRVITSLERTGHYLLHEPHPIVLIFFLLLLSISEILFIPPSLLLLPSPLILHYILVVLIPTLPYIFLYLSCTRHSFITPTNHSSAMSSYPYDYTLFHPPSATAPPCRTCQSAKPARSKHCSLCGHCVAKADHHCIWLNACVGRNNYVWFLLLLLSISLLCAYGAYLAYAILDSSLQSRFVPSALTLGSLTAKRWSTGLTWRRWIDCWGWSLRQHTRIGTVGLLAGMSWPLGTGLLFYHVYLIWAGMTTNESAKWGDMREDVTDGLVWRARREDLVGVEEMEREGRRGRWRGAGWPIRGQWVVAVLRPGETPEGRGGVNGYARGGTKPLWERVTSLAEVENVYDLGFWDNLRDALFNRD